MHSRGCQACAAPFAKHDVVCTTMCWDTVKHGTPCPSDISVLQSEGPGRFCAGLPQHPHGLANQADLDDRIVMSQGIEVEIEDSLANDVQSVAAEPVFHLNWAPLMGRLLKGARAIEGAVAKHVDHGGNVFAMKGGDNGSPAQEGHNL